MKHKLYFSGYGFERHLTGISSFGMKFDKSRKRPLFSVCLRDSVLSALRNKRTENFITRENASFNQIFLKVKEKLPKHLRRHLHLFITLGTGMDLYYGGDILLMLGTSFVVVDATSVLTTFNRGRYLEKYKRQTRNPWYFVFCPDDLYGIQADMTAQKIANMLIDRVSDEASNRFGFNQEDNIRIKELSIYVSKYKPG